MDRTLTGTTYPGQSGAKSNANEGALHAFQIPSNVVAEKKKKHYKMSKLMMIPKYKIRLIKCFTKTGNTGKICSGREIRILVWRAI